MHINEKSINTWNKEYNREKIGNTRNKMKQGNKIINI